MKYFFFDKRALALMRIAVSAVVLLDLGIRLSDLEAFYSNTGATPLPMIFRYCWNPYFISVHTTSGLWQVQLLIFLFHFFCAAMLFIGYRTRLFSFLCWFLLLSLHNRNGLILQGGDDLLRMVLFWGMFLPWGEKYSVDRLLGRETPELPVQFVSIAAVAYLLQICYIYTGSALLKGPEWNSEFSAMYYAYSLNQIAYPTTKLFYHHPEWMKALTCVAWYFELLVPVLFFIPVKHGAFRTIGVFAIIGFHLFNSVTLFIGLFPLIGISTALGILPWTFMNRFDRWTVRMKQRIAASFLGIAMLAGKIIRWRKPRETFLPMLLYVKNAALIFLVFFVFDWNFSNLSFINSKLSDDLRFIGFGLRLDQNWGMFAPGVFKDDGWFVLEGVKNDSTKINLLFPDQPLSYAKPASVVKMFPNDRWRKYSENYLMADNAYMRGYFCNYMKRVWNEHHPDQYIHTLRVIYMGELTLPDYHYSPPEKIVLWECVDE